MTVFLNPVKPSFPEPPYAGTVPPISISSSSLSDHCPGCFVQGSLRNIVLSQGATGQPSSAGVLVLCFSLFPVSLAVLVDRAMILENVFCMSVPPLKNLHFPYLYNSGLTLYHRIRKLDHILEFACYTISHNTDTVYLWLEREFTVFWCDVLTSMPTVSLVSWPRVCLTKIPWKTCSQCIVSASHALAASISLSF